jgi:hypothetical protein
MIPPASGKLSMPYNTVLISTMAVSFVYALLGGMLAQRLRLSPWSGICWRGCASEGRISAFLTLPAWSRQGLVQAEQPPG